MNSRITTALSLLAGLVGGMISHRLFDTTSVRAQGLPPEIRAQKFVLVDRNGTPRGVFGFRNDGSPDIQVKYENQRGLAKIIGGEVGSARWLGIDRKSMLSDLRPAQP